MCIYEYVCFVVSQKNIPVVDTNQFKAAQIFFFPRFIAHIILINLPPKFYSSTLNLKAGLFSFFIRFGILGHNVKY